MVQSKESASVFILRSIKNIREKRLCIKLGLLLALVHFIFCVYFAINLFHWSKNAQWELSWEFIFGIDFPVSLLYRVIIFNLPFNFNFDLLPFPASEFRTFILPTLLCSIIGTIWYFYLPSLFTVVIGNKLKRFIDSKRMVLGLSSALLGIFLFILSTAKIHLIESIDFHLIIISLFAVVIGLFFILASFIFKERKL